MVDQPQPVQFNYRSGDILLRRSVYGPLRVEAEHFRDCILRQEQPLTGIAHARTVVSILERARAFQADGNKAA